MKKFLKATLNVLISVGVFAQNNPQINAHITGKVIDAAMAEVKIEPKSAVDTSVKAK